MTTDPRGCPGNWDLFDNWTGYPAYSGTDTVPGFEYDDPIWQRTPGSSVAWQLVATGTDGRIMLSTGGINDSNSELYSSSKSFNKSDSSCVSPPPPPPPGQKYDCVNGACFTKETYNTPGIYTTLTDCEEACGTGCSGVCISNADWSAITGLANQHLQKDCQ